MFPLEHGRSRRGHVLLGAHVAVTRLFPSPTPLCLYFYTLQTETHTLSDRPETLYRNPSALCPLAASLPSVRSVRSREAATVGPKKSALEKSEND